MQKRFESQGILCVIYIIHTESWENSPVVGTFNEDNCSGMARKNPEIPLIVPKFLGRNVRELSCEGTWASDLQLHSSRPGRTKFIVFIYHSSFCYHFEARRVMDPLFMETKGTHNLSSGLWMERNAGYWPVWIEREKKKERRNDFICLNKANLIGGSCASRNFHKMLLSIPSPRLLCARTRTICTEIYRFIAVCACFKYRLHPEIKYENWASASSNSGGSVSPIGASSGHLIIDKTEHPGDN